METMILNGSLYAEMVKNGAANLNRNRTIVNELNVFPVPDGDTGDNMYLTIDSGAQAVKNTENLADVADQIAKGMLMGARGNSGVILSRIFSGIAKNLCGRETVDVAALGEALRGSIEEAYSAVSKPVEGTILSVYRDAVNVANEKSCESESIETFFDDFIRELHASLDRTPELLAVLKEAGVVDSGGAGFVYIAEGMKKALLGEKIENSGDKPQGATEQLDFDAFTEDSELTYGYCTEFLLRLQRKKCDIEAFDLEGFTAYLNSVGNSVVSFREGSVVKVHVHTMDPGAVLSYCRQYGEYLKLKIENMNLQHNEADENSAAGRADTIHVKKHKAHGIVTVANGDGMVKLFRELGADEVVEGGQSMNPSAQDFVKAFEDINCDDIIVFPNNSNIVMTAEQAAALYTKCPVYVVKTKTIGEGYAAISMMDTALPTAEEVVESAKEAIETVQTGMVSTATRETVMDGVEVHAGDYIGFCDDTILTDAKTAKEATVTLAEAMETGDFDLALLIRGKDAKPEEAAEIAEKLRASYKWTEIIEIDGGQPIYDYILVLE